MQVIDKLVMFHMAVNDMDKVKEFYEDKLGFKVTNDKAYGDKRWVSMEFPGGGASINLTTVHENMKPGTYKLYLSSPDVEAAYEELVSKGVKPAKEIADDWGKWNGSEDQGGKWFEVTDPDGNHLLIISA
jgi:catechol 2,3-dioxygenase-like lactoylglutathione lyase family enzyme